MALAETPFAAVHFTKREVRAIYIILDELDMKLSHDNMLHTMVREIEQRWPWNHHLREGLRQRGRTLRRPSGF
jgi:hypothetical protein